MTIEGAEGVAIHQNQITRCDGNGVFLGGYTRGVNITGNDMNYIGDSPMAAFGWTSPCLHADCKVKLPDKVGPDGRGGEQPRGSYVAGNLIREFGIWQKQSSAWFQALAALTTFNQNVVFNGPRAAVNFVSARQTTPFVILWLHSHRLLAIAERCFRWWQQSHRQPHVQSGAPTTTQYIIPT